MSQTIIITGAGRGIGRATAEAFLAAGWRVGLIGRSAAPLTDLAKSHDNALALTCDVTNETDVARAFEQVVGKWGRLDALFNNAGIMLPAATPDAVSVRDWRELIDINLTGSFICARAAFAQMRAQVPQGGRIINNGSLSAYVPREGSVAYTASKHAITGLTRSISLDGRPYSIACGQIDIGSARTDMILSMAKSAPQADAQTLPDPMMDVEHVAASVLHMASLPLEANVQFMTVMATTMKYIGRG